MILGHVAGLEGTRNAYGVLIDELHGNRKFGRSRRRWENNIKMLHKETGYVYIEFVRDGRD
jgi:hypothetical protein